MPTITPGDGVLGATVTGLDLSRPLSDADFATVLRALGAHAVLRFPDQPIDAAALKRLAARFGALQVVKGLPFHEPGMPEVSILSNIVVDGKPIGAADAGQDWHTDMSYNAVPGFVNLLVAHAVPVRDGQVLGATQFADTRAAYDALPADVKTRLADATATHDLNKYWEHMRRDKGSTRPPLTPQQRRDRPPAVHPVFLTHPISGRKAIYVNPGFTERIDQLPPAESDAMLRFLIEHVLRPEFRYVHRWRLGDLLLWDHLGTWHYAVPDYRPDEPRLMKRCQVMADRILDPAFVRAALEAPLTA